ncbi:MAG: methylated-DNA--[protein]-cysteine S-methyltransferase [Burkholderiaceae bacterium]
METINTPAFTLHFRAPGSRPAGPIQYAIGHCEQGAILVARSTRGICAIFLGDDAAGLGDQLRDAFPHSERVELARLPGNDLDRVIRYIDQRAVDEPMDLDIGGTPFQQRVWSALCNIPVGETLSYTQLAQFLGLPKAVRAVASACAANTLAIVVPCHRIVRSDGSITGYRWGPERKRDLLRWERTQCNQ